MELHTIVAVAVSIFTLMLAWELIISPLIGRYSLIGRSYSCIKLPLRKYYVSSGDLEEIVLAETPRFAALAAYERTPNGVRLDLHFYIDERGCRYYDATHSVSVDAIIEDYREVEDE